ncbi:phage tail protein [Blautia schinkii]|nr:phage tail protein [Blautia schinkii]
MIGYFGDIVFQTSDKKILTFTDFKRTASASFSEHDRIGKKSRLEFNGPENQEVTFKMKILAGHGVKPWNMLHKLIVACEKGEVRTLVIGTHKVGSGNYVITKLGAQYEHVWNAGELVGVSIDVTLKEYK